MQPLYILQAVDVRRADVEGTSRATTIAKMTIPKIEFASATHNPGGGVMEVDYTLPRIKALEPAFMAKGLDVEIFGELGAKGKWNFACAYRDTKTGKDVGMRGVIEGVPHLWEPDESDPEDFQGCNHVFKEVTHFELVLGDEELWYIDAEEREIRRKGKSLTEDVRGALGA
ncbi:MAG: phage major tail tube protein [Roseibium sp.]